MIEFITEIDERFGGAQMRVEQDGQIVAGFRGTKEEAQRLMDFYTLGVRYGHMGIGLDTKFLFQERED